MGAELLFGLVGGEGAKAGGLVDGGLGGDVSGEGGSGGGEWGDGEERRLSGCRPTHAVEFGPGVTTDWVPGARRAEAMTDRGVEGEAEEGIGIEVLTSGVWTVAMGKCEREIVSG